MVQWAVGRILVKYSDIGLFVSTLKERSKKHITMEPGLWGWGGSVGGYVTWGEPGGGCGIREEVSEEV